MIYQTAKQSEASERGAFAMAEALVAAVLGLSKWMTRYAGSATKAREAMA